jgi:hypothetical protein
MKRRFLVAAGAIAVLAIAAIVIVVLRGGSSASTGRNIPVRAQTALRLLLSAGGHQALTPELNALLPKGRLFPAGTTFTAKSGSWRQAGNYANVRGVLRVPDTSPADAEIGLVQRHGRWLVTFEAGQ